MAMTDLAIVRHSLLSRRFSTLVTVLTVAVGVALMLVLLSMRDAGKRSLQRGSGNVHLLVSADSSPLTSVLNAIFHARAPARAFSVKRAQELAQHPLIEWAVPIAQGDNYRGLPVVAAGEGFFTRFNPVPGRPFALESGHLPTGDFDVILGAQAARQTGLALGERLYVTHGTAGAPGHEHDDFPLRVAGILRPTGTSHDRCVFVTLNATWIIHAHDFRAARNDPEPATAQTLRDTERLITGVLVRAKGRAGGDTPATLPQLFSELRADPSITVASPAQQIDALFAIVGNVDRILLAVALVVLLSSAVTILLVMHNTMELRRRQIALLRVLGATRGRVFGLVLTEAALIGLAGAALGVLLAFGGAWATAAGIKARLGLVIEPSVEPLWALGVVALSALLACLAGALPALSAYRASVLSNLRPVG
jgi:putative ABC transport system permease protein